MIEADVSLSSCVGWLTIFQHECKTHVYQMVYEKLVLWGKICNQDLINALNRFATSQKCWSVLEKTIVSSVIILYISLFGMFSNICQ